jgi:acyl transferase domain-containing protein
VAGEHASLLTFACAVADSTELSSRYEVVGAVGNSMGWYTALAVAGALPLTDAIRLVDTMGSYQAGNVIGAQLLYPSANADWAPDPVLIAAVDDALARANAEGGRAWRSIRLGGFVVLGCDRPGLDLLMKQLPPQTIGSRNYPVQLPLHSAFHTPLLAETADRAQRELADLAFEAPSIPLVDGTGRIHRPIWASPAELASYTLGTQVTDEYDFVQSVRTALHHCAPDIVVLLGPGNSLGGPVARILVQDGWHGVASRADLNGGEPMLLSFGVTPQRAQLLAP